MADRQTLHRDMQQAGSGGITPEMEARRKTLGISDRSWRNVGSQISQTPGMLAAAVPPMIAKPTTPVATPPMETMANIGKKIVDGVSNFFGQNGKLAPAPAAPAINPVVVKQAPAAPVAPRQTGAQIANANITKMGVAGAVNDYRQRNPTPPRAPSQTLQSGTAVSKKSGLPEWNNNNYSPFLK